MGLKLKHRVKKLEQKNSIDDNLVTKIVVRYIDMEGKVSSTTIKKLIDGVWCEKVEESK